MSDPARQVAEARKYLRSVSQDEQGPLEHGDTIIAALCDTVDALSARLAQAERERDGEGPRPTDASGPGKQEVYWLGQKLKASIRHLRDIEDYYREQGGRPGSHNMTRADRARSIYEQISDDFLNGKLGVPTMRERAEQMEARLREYEEALRGVSNAYGCFAGCTGALAGAPEDGSGHTPACRTARAALTGDTDG